MPKVKKQRDAISVTLHKEVIKGIDEIAEKYGQKRSRLVDSVLRDFLSRAGKIEKEAK